MNRIVADIETRAAKDLINATQFAGQGLSDEEAYTAYRQDLEAERGSDFLPILYHVPISIAVGFVDEQYRLLSVETLCEHESPKEIESHMVYAFWELVNKGHSLITFNGRRFDMPVLEKEALRYGIQAQKYWVTGTRGPRYRFQEDYHYDVADVLSNSGAVPQMALNDLLLMLGYAGKGEVSGSKVQGLWEAGEHEVIHAYCRHDVAMTYVLWLRVELIRGRLTYSDYTTLCQAAEPWLADEALPSLEEVQAIFRSAREEARKQT